jgi:ubiquinone/menaquinone biosynthesis C-methylase UbiE
MTETVHHPVFARVYARLARAAESRGGAEHRRELLAATSGRVLELGAGAGSNFAHYPATVDELVAVEPERHLRERAERAAAEVGTRVSVHDAKAGALNFAEGSFDAGVVSLVLCTVPDQRQALAELFHVIRPGGTLHFYEHVRASRRGEARIQDLADATFWPRFAGGCHVGRDTAMVIRAAGFELESCRRFAYSPSRFLPAAPHILGVARRP